MNQITLTLILIGWMIALFFGAMYWVKKICKENERR